MAIKIAIPRFLIGTLAVLLLGTLLVACGASRITEERQNGSPSPERAGGTAQPGAFNGVEPALQASSQQERPQGEASSPAGEAGGLKVTLLSTNPGVFMATPLEGEVHYYYTDLGFEVSLENVADAQRALASYHFEVGTEQGWEPLNLKDVDEKDETLFSGEVRGYSLRFYDARNWKYFIHPEDAEPRLKDVRLRVLWDGQQEPVLDAKLAPHFPQETWQIPTRVLSTLPTTEEMAEMGLFGEGQNKERMMNRIIWQWGEYDIRENWSTGRGGEVPDLISGVLQSIFWIDNQFRHPNSDQSLVAQRTNWDEGSIQVAKWLGERLIDHEATDPSTGRPKLQRIYTVRVEPDSSVKPALHFTNDVANREYTGESIAYTYREAKFLVFSAAMEITFEAEQGKETARLKIKSAFPRSQSNIGVTQLRPSPNTKRPLKSVLPRIQLRNSY